MQSNDIEIDNNAVMAVSSTDDRFSWHRVWMVARYWWPLLRWKLLFFLLFSLAVGLTSSLFYQIYGDYTSFQLTGMTAYLCVFGCAVFGKKAGRQMRVGLPARDSEKLTFLLIFNLLVLPLVTVMACSLAMMIGIGEWPDQLVQTIFQTIGLKDMGIFYYTAQAYSTTLMMLASLVCLWIATTSRRHAFAKAIGYSLLTFIAPSFLMGLIVGISAYAFMKPLSLNNVAVLDQEALLKLMFHNMNAFFAVGFALLVIVWIACLYLFIRDFKKRQC